MKKFFFALNKKNIYGWGRGVYTMENKDTNTDYQGREPKVRIVETTFGIIFLSEICIHYFLYREFSSPTWKKSPERPIPTQNHKLTQVPPIYMFWKMAQPPYHPRGGVNYEMSIWNKNFEIFFAGFFS